MKQTGSLDLSFEFLKKIPDEVLELNHLESLNLRASKISDYSFLEKFSDLQSLQLIENHICYGRKSRRYAYWA